MPNIYHGNGKAEFEYFQKKYFLNEYPCTMTSAKGLDSLMYLRLKYNIGWEGVIHIGAYEAEEMKPYFANEIKHIIWVEAIKEKCNDIKRLITIWLSNPLNIRLAILFTYSMVLYMMYTILMES